jgi:hypothetical protein
MSRLQVLFDAPEQLDCLVPPDVDVALRFELLTQAGMPIDISHDTLFLKLYKGDKPGSSCFDPYIKSPGEHEDGKNGVTIFQLTRECIDTARTASGDSDGNSIPYRLYGRSRFYLEGIIGMAVSIRHADLPRLKLLPFR